MAAGARRTWAGCWARCMLCGERRRTPRSGCSSSGSAGGRGGGGGGAGRRRRVGKGREDTGSGQLLPFSRLGALVQTKRARAWDSVLYEWMIIRVVACWDLPFSGKWQLGNSQMPQHPPTPSRRQNEILWREVVTLRQSHGQQHRVIGKVSLSPTPLPSPTAEHTPLPSPLTHLEMPGKGGVKVQRTI